MSCFTLCGMERAGFISPHLDDAVLSCASVITPGSLVVTVFDSGPASVDPLPFWDVECGVFRPGDDVPAIRRREDDDAVQSLGSSAERLGFWAQQYRLPSNGRRNRLRRRLTGQGSDPEPIPATTVADALREVIEVSDRRIWFMPLGVAHRDHEITSEAGLELARHLSGIRWYIYEDLPYARESGTDVAAAWRRVAASGLQVAAAALGSAADPGRKRSAVARYRSQLRGLGERVELAIAGPEAYHAVVDAGTAET